MINDLFGFGDLPPKKQKKTKTTKPEPEIIDLVDITTLSLSEIQTNLKSQIYTQAMVPDPQSTILSLACKVFALSTPEKSELDDPIDGLTTEEILERIKRITEK